MKKIFFNACLILPVFVFSYLTAVSSAPIEKINKVEKYVDPKVIRNCVEFIINKKFVRTVHGYFHRSVGPTKKLVQSLFFHCDFHRDQLKMLELYVSELQKLINTLAPIAVRSIFISLPHPQVEQFICALGCQDGEQEVLNQPLFDCLESIDSYLYQKDPEMFDLLLEHRIKWKEFTSKWQEPILLLADYASTRLRARQDYIEKDIASFKRAMIWKHAGPSMSLAIQVAWNTRKITRYENGDDVFVLLMQEAYKQIIEKKSIIEQEILDFVRKTNDDYCSMLHEVIDKSLNLL